MIYLLLSSRAECEDANLFLGGAAVASCKSEMKEDGRKYTQSTNTGAGAAMVKELARMCVVGRH